MSEISKEFINNNCMAAITYLQYQTFILKDRHMLERISQLFKWIESESEQIKNCLNMSVSKEKELAFVELHTYLLDKAVLNEDLDAILDNLYFIPGAMKREYTLFKE